MSYYMNMSSFNEGEQAEAHKKKKAEEKEDIAVNHVSRIRKLDNNTYGDKQTAHNPNRDKSKIKDDSKRFIKANKMVDKNVDSEDYEWGYRAYAQDATNRHMRRHPKQYQECGIFSEVTFLNEGFNN